MSKFLIYASVLGTALLVSACGSGDDGQDGANGATGAAGANGAAGTSALVALTAEPAGSNCTSGGTKVTAGPDSNGNGLLDTSEITQTQYVCTGATGATGTTGATGATGTTGATGATGAAGAAGASALLALSTEPNGANCAYGGTRVDAGIDSDASGTLGASEITSTSYVCRSSAAWVATDVALQTVANTNYLATSGSAQVTLTLPTNPAVGDVVAVTGAGAAGWKLAQNAGQTVLTKGLPGSLSVGTFTTLSGAPSGGWFSVATSSDGQSVYATNGTLLYRSSDAGATWSDIGPAGLANGTDVSIVATSADGNRVVAAGSGAGVYVSSDHGQTWSGPVAGLPTTNFWSSVAVSADGSHLLATSANDGDTHVYVSVDGGGTWAAAPGVTAPNGWIGVAASADGSHLVAAARVGQIWASTNGGTSWAALGTSANTTWSSITLSSNGAVIAAADFNGPIQVSTDSGASWTARASTRNWWSLSASADGSTMIASTQQGALYSSTDQGTTWTAPAADWPPASLPLVAASADGSHLYAVSQHAGVASAVAQHSALGTGGYLAGSLGDSLTLQYVGNGQFIVLAYTNNSGSFTIH